MGKYKTHLYYKGEDTYSSMSGGIITIVITVSLIIYAVMTIKGILEKDSFHFDEETLNIQPLQFVTDPKTGAQEMVQAECKDCKSITLRDIVPSLFNETTYLIPFGIDKTSGKQSEIDCSNLAIDIVIRKKDTQREVIKTFNSDSFKESKNFFKSCETTFFPKDIVELDKIIPHLDDLAFYIPESNRDILQLRLEVHVRGLGPTTSVRKMYKNTQSASKAGLINSFFPTEGWKI